MAAGQDATVPAVDDAELSISAVGVRKTYGSARALDGANLRVRSGESRALLGRNGAGKSTLIGVLTGLVQPDEGTVRIRRADGSMPAGATAGAAPGAIACVYQRSTLVDSLTAAENISLGAHPRTRWGAVDWKRLRRTGGDLLEQWGFAQLRDREAGTLEPLERKVVEVCRAMVTEPRILLLDEPTAGLDEGATQQLFSQIAAAKARGVTILYVSHHLAEVFEICDTVTILRDGRDILTKPTSELSIESIVTAMSGTSPAAGASRGEVSTAARTRVDPAKPAVLQVRDVCVEGRVSDVSFDVPAGAAVGLTGLNGAGHVQLGQVIAGQISADRGHVAVNGRRVQPRVADAIRAGVGFVPEDRHVDGFVPGMTVEENATLSILRELRGPAGTIDTRRRASHYHRQATAWMIKAQPSQNAEELSGGNQQKVVLARALASGPDVLVAINPTAGVDVTAKDSIYTSLAELRDAGKTLLIVSTDDDDLAFCDQVLVMFKGRLDSRIDAGYDEDDLIAAVQGVLRNTPTVVSRDNTSATGASQARTPSYPLSSEETA
jgi:simple sugar transport system ATP-binding protein